MHCTLIWGTLNSMGYEVIFQKKVLKELDRLPDLIQDKFLTLVEDLKTKGPIQPEWKNYSKLDGNKYHCHLSYSWVACWRYEKGKLIIEVYYVGSRENAPY